ncbi:GNAT family N-acetyltransferase [Marmoricola sp. RAF53]|uniref:GNAT family N-acetyltransferase n=1 Tax=Marmoricola sp. RAF53 TaxID=3233059 RepID=UPI003F9525A9
MGVTRLVTVDDAAEIAELYRTNEEFLRPWDPAREPVFFTEAEQRRLIEVALEGHERGTARPLAIVAEDGTIAGRLFMNAITYGALRSTTLGYWLGEKFTGQGLASAAVAEAVGIAFDELELHRVEAGTLLHNVSSQAVLRRNGFTPYGVVPKFLKIEGRWQDHLLFHRLNPAVGDD